MSEFYEFELASSKIGRKPVTVERRLKSWNIELNFKWNQPYLSWASNLSRGSNSLNSASCSLWRYLILHWSACNGTHRFRNLPHSPCLQKSLQDLEEMQLNLELSLFYKLWFFIHTCLQHVWNHRYRSS